MEEINNEQDNIQNENNIENQENIENENNIENQNQENVENNNNQENVENNNNQEHIENNNNQEHIENNNNENINQDQNQQNIENNNIIENQNPENNNQVQQNNIINNNIPNGQQINQNIPPPHINQNNNNIINQENNNNVNEPNNQNDQNNQNIELMNRVREENEKTVEIIKSKIKDLREKYYFASNYYDIMHQILKYFQDLAYEKITNSINEYFNYFSFFKNSSELYSKFAEQINVSNSSIMSSLKVPKMNDNFLLGVMQKTQNLLFQNLSQISNGLKQNIISKGPLSKLQEKVNKIEQIKKANLNKFKDIDEVKKKLSKRFHKYDKLFDSYLPENNLNNNNANNRNRSPMPSLVDTPDFIDIIQNLLELINKLILDINLFIIDTKDCFYKLNQIFVEMNNLLRDAVLIYIQESKKVFNIDVTKNFEEIENYYKKLDKSDQDKMFKINQIFHNNQNREHMLDLLQRYYVLLCNSGRVKNELLSDRNTFSIYKYPNTLLFFEWLISVSPQLINITNEELILKKVRVKRDPGLFHGWREVVMVFTRQKHLLLYDVQEKMENYVKIFELDKTSFRKKIDNKRPFMFELVANRKGKLMDFKGIYLFDGLNEQNINVIHPLVLSAYNG